MTTTVDRNMSYILTGNKTVNITSSMTTTDIQVLINSQPKDLNGYNLTFRFADGTYSLNAGLLFSGYINGGVFIEGNTSDNTLSTTKSVVLNFSSANGIGVYDCACTVQVNYLKVTNADGGMCIWGKNVIAFFVGYNYCVCVNNTNSSNRPINVSFCYAYIYNNYVTYGRYGILAVQSVVFSTNNPSTVNNPFYGLGASVIARIAKNSSTQPTGTSANEYTDGGSEIFNTGQSN